MLRRFLISCAGCRGFRARGRLRRRAAEPERSVLARRARQLRHDRRRRATRPTVTACAGSATTAARSAASRAPTFCLDLRFWYPGRAYDYELVEPGGELRNRDGDRVAPESLRRMNYAMWNFGRTTKKADQGAVMLYVHRLMGDGAPGEVDPVGARAPAVARGLRARRARRRALRRALPRRAEAADESLPVRRKATLEVRVLAASGRVVPNVEVDARSRAAPAGLPAKVDTGDDGVAQPSFTPDDAKGGVRVTATSGAARRGPAADLRARAARTRRATASASPRPRRRR